jgi:hypothetical protein
MTAAPDVFLSYNREDQSVAKRFAEAFEAAGLYAIEMPVGPDGPVSAQPSVRF